MDKQKPPVCNYEGSEYQKTFWDEGGRAYEDAAEAVALRRLLPMGGKFMLELGAGAGRNTLRYQGYDQIALLDYSRTQLEQARARLGDSDKFLYVAADVYDLPFVDGLFDGATMIRTLHHMAEPEQALSEVRRVMAQNGTFILEFANKRNLKAILRYLFQQQSWNPFSQEPIEFAALNFDFHPKAVRCYLHNNGFRVRKQLAVSHFRVGFLKRMIPKRILVEMDSLLQWTGAFLQISPSVFTKAQAVGGSQLNQTDAIFKCPSCGNILNGISQNLLCGHCNALWEYQDGIYDFRLAENSSINNKVTG